VAPPDTHSQANQTTLEKIKEMHGKKALPPDRIIPTVGQNIGAVDVGGTKLTVWDLGGQERLQKLWSQYYEDADGVLFVIDSADEARFPEAKEALERVMGDPELSTAKPVLVLANKQDLDDAALPGTVAEAIGLPEWTTARSAHIQSMSALSGEGIQAGLDWILAAMSRA